MNKLDPKLAAQERFADAKVASNDLIGQRVTDVPLVVRTSSRPCTSGQLRVAA
jgi:hypothetical protein